jgi:hypothetical protein
MQLYGELVQHADRSRPADRDVQILFQGHIAIGCYNVGIRVLIGFNKNSRIWYSSEVPIGKTCHGVITVAKPGSMERKGVFYARFPWRVYISALINNSKWKQRGWTLQEQIFSTRLLYFTDDIISFECLTMQKVEDPEYGVPDALSIPWLPDKKSKESYRTILQFHDPKSLPIQNKIYLGWYSIVEEYSKRQLSFAGDKLPALSGLAYKFALAIDDDYLAGLWKGDLWRGMMWEPQFRQEMKQPPGYRCLSLSGQGSRSLWRSKMRYGLWIVIGRRYCGSSNCLHWSV